MASRKTSGGAAEAPAAVPPEQTTTEEARLLSRFADVPLELSFQLDRKPITVGGLLALEVNTTLKTERSAGENVDLLLDGVVVGNGEIVVIEEMMGLRITDLYVSRFEETN
jgi:flagellar motor switch protein FliN